LFAATLKKPPLTVKLAFDCVVGVSEMDKLLKVKVPLLTIDQPVVAIEIALPPEAVRAEEPLTVKAPLMLKAHVLVVTPAPAMVKLKNTKVPELAIEELAFMVMVLVAVTENIPAAVKTPPTVAVCVPEFKVPLTFKPPLPALP
jgi:hypothetical protein